MIIVSACLAGVNCRFDGGNKANKKVIELVRKGKAIPICPEQLAGMTTPREAHEIKGARVVNKKGNNRTKAFQRGAKETLRIAKTFRVKEAIMKNKSPSCGCGKVFDGSFTGTLIEGDGITTRLLKENEIKIKSDEEV